jgi:hypothetical protein
MYFFLSGVINYYFIQFILLKLVVYVFKLILLIFLYSLDGTTILRHYPYEREDDTAIIRLFLCFPNASY